MVLLWSFGAARGPTMYRDRKSTRLNSSHSQISYAVFCLKKLGFVGGAAGGEQEEREFFFFNDTATTEIYTLSLHDALPISGASACPTRDPGPSASTASRSLCRGSRRWSCSGRSAPRAGPRCTEIGRAHV